MEKVGMVYGSDLDHPSIPELSPLRRHVLYSLKRANWHEKSLTNSHPGVTSGDLARRARSSLGYHNLVECRCQLVDLRLSYRVRCFLSLQVGDRDIKGRMAQPNADRVHGDSGVVVQ